MSQELQKARAYEAAAAREIPAGLRPAFHLTPQAGWTNDPNGFSFYQGKYHLFYQYHPYGCYWGPMHWGHAVSADLLHWEYLPAALAPDTPPDARGCYSGSALALDDGRQLLVYTGVSGAAQTVQAQCLAFGDGSEYVKWEGNPAVTADELPEGYSRTDFRDPKIRREADSSWHLAVAACVNRTAGGVSQDGRIVEFVSREEVPLHWSFRRVLKENNGRFGGMWECPDYFALDGKRILLVSTCGMLAEGDEYSNGHENVCFVGHEDAEGGAFAEESAQCTDHGIDFYAAQTLAAPDGRRILIAWMQDWDCASKPVPGLPWLGQMTVPRELSVRGGRLFQWPVREIESLRGPCVRYGNVSPAPVGERQTADAWTELPGVRGRILDLELALAAENGSLKDQEFVLRFAVGGRFYTELAFDAAKRLLTVDRRFCGWRRNLVHTRSCPCAPGADGRLRLRLLLDRFSAEVFINGGERAMTTTFYTEQGADRILFAARGGVRLDVSCWPLEQRDNEARP